MSVARPPELESNDATDELSDFKLSLSRDSEEGTTAVLLEVFRKLRLRFFGGNGGGDSSIAQLKKNSFCIIITCWAWQLTLSRIGLEFTCPVTAVWAVVRHRYLIECEIIHASLILFGSSVLGADVH